MLSQLCGTTECRAVNIDCVVVELLIFGKEKRNKGCTQEVQPAPGLPQMLSHSRSTKPQAFRIYSETLGRIHMLSADIKRPFFFFYYNFQAFYYPLKFQVWMSYATKQCSEGSKAIE